MLPFEDCERLSPQATYREDAALLDEQSPSPAGREEPDEDADEKNVPVSNARDAIRFKPYE